MEGSANLTLWVVVLALPLVLALATAFTKASVVLGALRLGFSAEALLPLPVVFALSLLVTAIVMAPTADALVSAVEQAGGVAGIVAEPSRWQVALTPLLEFCSTHADPTEVEFFAELTVRPAGTPIVTISAFVVTELAEAFAIAIALLIPLVLVDLLAAQALVLMGLAQQPTVMVTVPIKLLLFLAVGGWDLVIGGLVQGYR